MELNIRVGLNKYNQAILNIKSEKIIENLNLKNKEINIKKILKNKNIFSKIKKYKHINIIFEEKSEKFIEKIEKIYFPHFNSLKIIFEPLISKELNFLLENGKYEKIEIKNIAKNIKLNLHYEKIEITKELFLSGINILNDLKLNNLENLKIIKSNFLKMEAKNILNNDIIMCNGYNMIICSCENININNTKLEKLNLSSKNKDMKNIKINDNVIINIINSDIKQLNVKKLNNYMIDIKYSKIDDIHIEELNILNINNIKNKKIFVKNSENIFLTNISSFNYHINNVGYLKIEDIKKIKNDFEYLHNSVSKFQNIKYFEIDINRDFDFSSFLIKNIETININIYSGFVEIKMLDDNIIFNQCFVTNLIDYMLELKNNVLNFKINIKKHFKYYDNNIVEILKTLENTFNKKIVDINKIYLIYSYYIEKIKYKKICKDSLPDVINKKKLKKFKTKTNHKLNEI